MVHKLPIICLMRISIQLGLFVIGIFFFSDATLAEQNEPELDLDFQVYLWRALTTVEDIVGDDSTSSPSNVSRQRDESSREASVTDTPEGDATRAYRAPEIYYLADSDSEVTRVRAAEGRLSRSYAYRGTNPIVFFRKVKLGEEVRREILGEVHVEKGLGRVLLLFLPTRESSGAYRILPLENSLERVPSGRALIYNFTRGPLACRIGDRDFILAPGTYERLSLSRVEDFTLPVHLATQSEPGEWEAIHRQDVIVNPESSLLFLIYRAQGTQGQLRILTLEN